MDRRLLAAIAATIIVVAGVAGMIYWNSLKPPANHAGDVDGGDGPGALRIENTTDGNWILKIVSGSASPSKVRMMILNSSTGGKTVDKPISELSPQNNDPDAIFNDCSGNNKIDAGDTILLKGSSPNIRSGYRVQFLMGESIIASIKEIP